MNRTFRRGISNSLGHTSLPYQIGQRVASGRTADVNVLYDVKNPSQKLVGKIFYEPLARFSERESRILKSLNGQNCKHIVPLVDEFRIGGRPVLVFPRLTSLHKRTWLSFNNLGMIKDLSWQLLKALSTCHDLGIIHRDIKPDNIMVGMTSNGPLLTLIDWGLAEYSDASNLSPNVCCRAFKAPELLLKHSRYDKKVDSWAMGCLLLGFLTKKEVFFRGSDDLQQLLSIVDALGSKPMLDAISRQGIVISPGLESILKRSINSPGLISKLIIPSSESSLLLLDLALRLCKPDPMDRLDMKEAMLHPYFDSIRKVEGLHQRATGLVAINV